MNTKFTIAYFCVFVAAMMPFVCSYLAKTANKGKRRREGGYDNAQPRAWLGQLTGWHARANAAQANCFEALPFFIGAVVIAHQLAAPQLWVDALAVLFVVLRVAYIALYLRDKPAVRSAVWAAALLTNIAILFIGW